MVVQPAKSPVILASASAIRLTLLRQAGVDVAVQPAQVDEVAVRDAMRAQGITTLDAATKLAELKGEQVSSGVSGSALVIAADQILESDGAWLEKPTSRALAEAQLIQLRGRVHYLVTACVAYREGVRVWHHAGRATITMRDFSEQFLARYLDQAGDAATQSVGGYHLEGLGAQLIQSHQGDYFSILGLPLIPVLAMLREQRILQS